MDAPGGRILIVDDTAESVRLLAALLESRHYDVVTATNGEDALSAIAHERPDLVLLDVYMPGIDGYEVCRRLRNDPATATLPVVMLTSAGAEERLAGLEAGADDFITKPFVSAELLARVRSLLRIKTYHDTIQAQAAQLVEWNRSLERRVDAQVAELERLSRLRRFLSPQVANAVVAADDDWLLDTHRAEIAVVFCDIRGFTAFARGVEPEEVMSVLERFHLMLGKRVEQYEATVGYFAGDGVMLFLNDPVPCNDPAARAVALALDLVADVSLEQTLGVGVGVTLGYATLGVMGFEGRYEYGAIGTVVNLASRLCDEAAPGEVIVSQAVYAAIADDVVLEPRGPLALKGFPEPVSAWRVVAGELSVAAAPSPPVPAAVDGDYDYVFRAGDGEWTLRYDDVTVQLRPSKGLQYLASLLASPGREISVAELAGVEVLGDAGEVLDDQARAAYQRRIEALKAERAEAAEYGDLDRAARAEDEMDFIARELAAAFGLGGRARKAADTGERARKAVTNRIKDAITKIESVHPTLGRHLANAIRTGTYCAYDPERPVDWQL